MPYCANLVGIWPSQVLIDTFVQFGRATPIRAIFSVVTPSRTRSDVLIQAERWENRDAASSLAKQIKLNSSSVKRRESSLSKVTSRCFVWFKTSFIVFLQRYEDLKYCQVLKISHLAKNRP